MKMAELFSPESVSIHPKTYWNTELSDLRKIFCLRKSEVSVERNFSF